MRGEVYRDSVRRVYLREHLARPAVPGPSQSAAWPRSFPVRESNDAGDEGQAAETGNRGGGEVREVGGIPARKTLGALLGFWDGRSQSSSVVGPIVLEGTQGPGAEVTIGKVLQCEFRGPRKFSQSLDRLSSRLVGGTNRPPCDYADLVDRFSRGEALSRGDQRRLAYAMLEGQPPLLERDCRAKALELMGRQLEAGSSVALEGAIYCLLQMPPGRTQGLTILRRWVAKNLRSFGPKYRLLEHWRHHSLLFEEDDLGPKYLADLILQESDLSEGLSRSRIPGHCWLAEAALPFLAVRMAAGEPERRAALYAFLEDGHVHAIPGVVGVMLNRFMEPGARRQRIPDIEAFFLKHLGHPSMDRKGLWQTIDEPARALARKWVNEKNVKLFYDHLVQYGDKRRLNFWMQYLDQVDDVRIVMGSGDLNSASREVREAIRSADIGRLFRSGSSAANLSAVFLRLGQWWIVEFSRKGNATYAYRDTDKPRDFWWGRDQYRMIDLKVRSDWPHRVIHPAGNLSASQWQHDYVAGLRVALNNEFPPAGFVPRR